MDGLYRNVEALDPARHGDRSVVPTGGRYAFARRTISVPLGLGEIVPAHRHYPIVFAPESGQALAVLGVAATGNLFLDKDGAWAKDTYVPAYIRRYPFVLIDTGDIERQILGIDATPDAVEVSARQPLFDGGRPGRITHEALRLCRAFAIDARECAELVGALRNAGILEERTAMLDPYDAGKQNVSGFYCVDEAKLTAISDPIFAAWRHRGWLAPIYAHLMSFAAWAGLLERLRRAVGTADPDQVTIPEPPSTRARGSGMGILEGV